MSLEGSFEGFDPFVEILFENESEPVKVLVDTGFTGELMLQEDLIERLNLETIGADMYTTASGAEVSTTIHLGFLRWMGHTRRVAVLATEGKTALLGMGLLFSHVIHMEPSAGILSIQ